MYLLDTNVVSELRKVRPGNADVGVAEWSTKVDAAELYLSAVSILEIELGVLLIERRDSRQGALLRRWFEQQVLPEFEMRTLPIDAQVARRAARLHVPDKRGERDALIAASALIHGMTVVTRNITDFKPTGVSLLNPWSGNQVKGRNKPRP
jgi:predicted nucleic acid-binding protein